MIELKDIHKATYRKHLKIISIAGVSLLLFLSLSISALLIYVIGDLPESNFKLNLAGVVIAAGLCGAGLYVNRQHPFMHEVYYVWQLKQALNRIYRKTAQLEKALNENQKNAFIISLYHLEGSEQVYFLDDNTLTMDELKQQKQALEEKIAHAGLQISSADYHPDLLKTLS